MPTFITIVIMIENLLFLSAIVVLAGLVGSKRVSVEMVIMGSLTAAVVVVSTLLIIVPILLVIIELVEILVGIIELALGFIEIVEVVLRFITAGYSVDIIVIGLVLAIAEEVTIEVMEVVLVDSIILVVNRGPVPQLFIAKAIMV